MFHHWLRIQIENMVLLCCGQMCACLWPYLWKMTRHRTTMCTKCNEWRNSHILEVEWRVKQLFHNNSTKINQLKSCWSETTANGTKHTTQIIGSCVSLQIVMRPGPTSTLYIHCIHMLNTFDASLLTEICSLSIIYLSCCTTLFLKRLSWDKAKAVVFSNNSQTPELEITKSNCKHLVCQEIFMTASSEFIYSPFLWFLLWPQWTWWHNKS